MKKNEFNYITDKLDILDERLDNVESVLKVQEHQLAIHIRRTELLEEQVSPLNKFMYAAYGIIGFIVFAATASALITFLK